jgi:hypothetical protein
MIDIIPNVVNTVNTVKPNTVNTVKPSTVDIHKVLRELPDNDSLFKCQQCKVIFDIYSGGFPVLMALSDKNGMLCPECKSENTDIMCKVDSYSLTLKLNGFVCREEVLINGADICPECNMPVCPICMNHHVISLSRVTGYVSDISGWNAAKKQTER